MDTLNTIRKVFEESIAAKKTFLSGGENLKRIAEAAKMIAGRISNGGKVIVFGNGGSAADSQHMAAELMVRFEKERRALPCIALNTNTSVITAAANDYDFVRVFSRQIEALGTCEDIAVAISTSGNSPNVLEGVRTAKAAGMPVIALAGRNGGELARIADISIVVDNENTARVQEVHILLIHILCKLIESEFC